MSAPKSNAPRSLAGELIVPAIALIGCLLYWVDVQEARSVARRVPDLVIIFVIAMTVIVLIQTFASMKLNSSNDDGHERTEIDKKSLARGVIFILLCVLYYVLFNIIGFNLANFVFLLCAYPLAGLSIRSTALAAVISSVSFYGLARLMEFNVPIGPFGI